MDRAARCGRLVPLQKVVKLERSPSLETTGFGAMERLDWSGPAVATGAAEQLQWRKSAVVSEMDAGSAERTEP